MLKLPSWILGHARTLESQGRQRTRILGVAFSSGVKKKLRSVRCAHHSSVWAPNSQLHPEAHFYGQIKNLPEWEFIMEMLTGFYPEKG